jgi:hypothetical protein
MKPKMMFAVVLVVFAVSIGHAQQDATWARWQWLMGEWMGEGTGAPGEGTGSFSFAQALDGKVLQRKSRTEFPASQGRPAFSHDDLMIVYPGQAGAADHAIYFDNEGHVINYVARVAADSVVLTSEPIPRMPLFRLTYVRLNETSIQVTFAIAPDGVNFRTYLDGRSRRVK